MEERDKEIEEKEEKDTYLELLKRSYLKTGGVTLGVTLIALALCPFVEAMVKDRGAYVTLIALLVVSIFVFGTSSFLIRRVATNMREGVEEAQKKKYSVAYRIRIVSLGVMMALSAIVYLLTRLDQGLYLSGIFLLLLLLTYPSRVYVYKE
jgi:uncharacterized membrane protein